MKWVRYEVHTWGQDADAVGETLLECEINGYEVIDRVPLRPEEERAMYTDIPKELGEDDGRAVLVFYTEAPENAERDFFSTGSSLRDAELSEQEEVLKPEEWIKKLECLWEERQNVFQMGLPEITYRIEDDSLWKDKWKENFTSFRVAEDIIIKPSWEEMPEDAREGDLIVEMDPGSAFGSGTHETTKLCLLALRKYITSETRVMDVGCGSGILAITAILCGAKSVFCMDIDKTAVEGTLENAEKNHISNEKLTAVCGDILKDAKRLKQEMSEPFHVIVANILADVIIPLSAVVKDFLAEGGIFLSSGILKERSGDVEDALRKNGFQILEKNVMGEWCAFTAYVSEKAHSVDRGMKAY